VRLTTDIRYVASPQGWLRGLLLIIGQTGLEVDFLLRIDVR